MRRSSATIPMNHSILCCTLRTRSLTLKCRDCRTPSQTTMDYALEPICLWTHVFFTVFVNYANALRLCLVQFHYCSLFTVLSVTRCSIEGISFSENIARYTHKQIKTHIWCADAVRGAHFYFRRPHASVASIRFRKYLDRSLYEWVRSCK